MYFPNVQPWVVESQIRESELRALDAERASVLARLEGLEVCEATKAIFERYVSGELTIRELGGAIDKYADRNAGAERMRE